MTEISEPIRKAASALSGQDTATLILAAKLVIAMLERNINADASSEPAA